LEQKSKAILRGRQKIRFLTAASFPKKDFYTPPTKKKNLQQTFVLHTQNSTLFVLRTQKSAKKQAQKSWKKAAKKAAQKAAKMFISEPVLKPV